MPRSIDHVFRWARRLLSSIKPENVAQGGMKPCGEWLGETEAGSNYSPINLLGGFANTVVDRGESKVHYVLKGTDRYNPINEQVVYASRVDDLKSIDRTRGFQIVFF